MINFSNTYVDLPDDFYTKEMPAKFKDPQLLIFNDELARELSIDFKGASEDELAKIFSGQKILKGSEPIATVYAAHQFGHFVPMLGDGRAHLLGETKGFDIQLKGSGATRFSRNGDGRSSLGPVIREYIVSEAMHYLGVPTTRALAAVATGEYVFRQDMEPGGVFTRVSPSHLRVGTFQYFAARHEVESVSKLLHYAIQRHYPELLSLDSEAEKAMGLLRALTKKQAQLVSKWMSLGFIHGVMNTDNFSIAGVTIDYGPCAFMDEFSFNKVFSSIDRNGRYAYSNQSNIACWNILRLADCLLPLINEDRNLAAKQVEEVLLDDFNQFDQFYLEEMGKKFGLTTVEKEDEKLITDFLSLLEKKELDFTNSFTLLREKLVGEATKDELFSDFIQEWISRAPDGALMKKTNPIYIPRNHQVAKAIADAFEGNLDHFDDMVTLLKNPYERNLDLDHLSKQPELSERVLQTFCGT